MSEVRYYFIN